MENPKYSEYLNSDQWKSIKAKVITRAKGKCEGCNNETSLEVHHKTYERIGMELMIDLVALCKYCHMSAHHNVNKSDWSDYINNITDKKPINFSELSREEQLNFISKMGA